MKDYAIAAYVVIGFLVAMYCLLTGELEFKGSWSNPFIILIWLWPLYFVFWAIAVIQRKRRGP
jgi:lipopolysaccharide export LptBFGC system permease protein LptF